MVCRDKEIQTILGCLITSRIRQESELLVIIDVEAKHIPMYLVSSGMCRLVLLVLVLCTSFAATNTSPMSSCVCGPADRAGRTCGSFLFSSMGMTTSHTISTPHLLLFGPFTGKGLAKGPLPCVWGREGGLQVVESCQQCSSST